MSKPINNVNISGFRPLISPDTLLKEIPISPSAQQTVINARESITKIIQGYDDRLLVICGPCSIHDPIAALEYANLLKKSMERLKNELVIVMRAYFEKPRTTIGWKGLINDPYLNKTFMINEGLRVVRRLLLDIAELGLPTGTEFLDTVVPQFLSDVISWGAIGARTTRSQIHRELASGLSMPIGFKNAVDGNIDSAVDGIYTAAHPHHFVGVTKHGVFTIVDTKGNNNCHLILRGSILGPNYDAKTVQKSVQLLQESGCIPRLMIDLSHGNSQKQFKKQAVVAKSVIEQISGGSSHVLGVMIESNLVEGRQDLKHHMNLNFGQSITDACLGWKQTEIILDELSQAVKLRRNIAV